MLWDTAAIITVAVWVCCVAQRGAQHNLWSGRGEGEQLGLNKWKYQKHLVG